MHKPNAAAQCSVPCNLCGSTDAEQVRSKDRHGEHLRSVICRPCGFVWTDPRTTPEQVRGFYGHEYRLNYKQTYQPKANRTYPCGKAPAQLFRPLQPFL